MLIDDVLAKAGVDKKEIGAVAVTEGPGLAGALLVGASVAHAVGYALGIPVVGVHHLEGHLLSACLSDPAPQFPFLALLVSGGHTQFMRVNSFGSYELLGETLDDAAGEAFDKTAQLLGEGYPGGPAVSRLALDGRKGAIELPRPMLHSASLDMSFSGLKTAVLTAVNDAADPTDPQFRSDLALAFTEAVAEVLTTKAVKAIKTTGIRQLVVAGGVSANKTLRESLIEACRRRGARVDNGAMIAVAGLMRLQHMTEEEREAARHRWSFSAKPRWTLSQAARPDAVDPRQRLRNR